MLVGGFMIFAAAWTPVIRQFDTIVEYFQSFLGYVTMPVVVILLGGLFWPRGTKQAAFWSIAIAGPIGFFGGFLTGELLGLHDVQFLYGTGIMVLLSTVLYLGISLRTEAPAAEDLEGLTWSRETWKDETEELQGTPWYLDYRVLGGAMVAVTLVIVIPLSLTGG